MTPSRPLEKDLERQVREYALRKGCLFYKFTSPGQNHVPDRLILSPMGAVLFMELKRPGGRLKLKPAQKLEAKKLQGHNQLVVACNDLDEAKKLIDGLLSL